MTVNSQIWAQGCQAVTSAMTSYTKPFITPISSPSLYQANFGTHEGTGNYIELAGQKFLVTNEHVISHNQQAGKAIMLHGNPSYFAISNFFSHPAPFDVSLTHVSSQIWNNITPNQAATVPEADIALNHGDNFEEIFFIQGFPGQFSLSMPGQITTQPVALATQQLPCPQTSNLHFCVNFNPTALPGTSSSFSNPKGMSGSLVWNTQYFECLTAGKTWTPDQAVVTGLAYLWHEENNLLECIRIEYVRSVILRAFSDMQANGVVTVT